MTKCLVKLNFNFMKTVQNYFLANLACGDLLIGTYV